jgi:hypothetical protein
MNASSSLIGTLLGIATLIVSQPLLGRLDRKRIREKVEQNGGKVMAIERRFWSGFGARYSRTYDVTYIAPNNKSITATCITNMTRGVSWVSDRPPQN